ncbi:MULTISPECIES: hypothetical protein [unclassified Agarivorans]|uniref:hypothetical protein n=1 Tax=unclassified Agarivorans TaxID=2636026 RepID=UPI0026E3458D|nr:MULTISPECIES: hypothetical protein [unclassified Agarivorans]MDO6686536.1 hypothetical protein [Agarivorans sp. 3_MG-2023]MDO6715354.1 hypothetical protein [Agarivorans sp. 2_MG-2023]
MSKNAVFKITMLAGAIALAGCTDSIEEPTDPVDPPIDPPVGEVFVVIDDGVTASGFGVLAGSDVDYSKNALAKDESYSVANGIAVSPSANGDEYSWKVDTYGAGEAYFIVGSDTAMDMTDYANGVLLFDMSVTNATASDSAGHQIVMQTNGGEKDYLDRNTFYFGQSQLSDQESAGWKTYAVKVSCFAADDAGAFDITKVNEVFRLDIRKESVTYELGTVKYEKDATMIPEGAVEWTCAE